MTDIRQNDELLITPTLRERLHLEGCFEGAKGAIWSVLLRSNGQPVEVLSTKAKGWNPLPEQKMFAHDMVRALNKHLHHDGKWIVAFTHPSTFKTPAQHATKCVYFNRWLFLFVDKDGDPQFTMDNDNLFAEVLEAGPDKWMEDAERAWQTWHTHMREVIDQKGVTFKKAQGEKAPSVAANLPQPQTSFLH